ncbi:MAG TPA: cation:proton antiporter [Candidatus Binatia bacterium]
METALTKLLGLLGGLLVLAFFANRLSKQTRVPDVVILITTGLILGPVSGWVDAGQLKIFTQYLGSFALILILFQAGYELHLRDALRLLPAAVLFGLVGYGLSFAVVSFIAFWMLNIPLHQGLLLGAVFGCTSSTMIIPVLQQLEIRGSVAIVLILEAALGDIVSVVSVGSLLEMSQGDTLLMGLIIGFFARISVAIVAAILAGFIWSRLRSRFTADRFSSVLNIGAILIVYALVSSAGGSGLLAVLVFGVTLANASNDVNESIAGPEQGVLIFHSDLSFLVRSFFFVLLGASVQVIDRSYAIATVLILAGLVIARVISVSSTRWALKTVTSSERQILFWLFPRGLVNAVLAIQVAGREPALFFASEMALTVIVVTNLLMVLGAFRFRSHPSV